MEETLQGRLQAQIEKFPGKCAIYCVDMTDNRVIAAVSEEVQVVSASTIKVPVMMCAFQEVLEENLSLQQFVPLEEGDLCQDTEVFVEEYRRDGASLWEMLYWMVTKSDNTATNAVLRLLGFEKINGYCRKIGLKSTCIQRKMLDFEAVEAGRNNYTSASDQYICYDLLINDKILTPHLCGIARDLLGRCRYMDGIQRFLCDGVKVYHKPGGLDHLNHDAGVICLPGRPYYLGVFTWEGPALDGEPEQERFIGRLSRMVYDDLTKEDGR